MSKTPPRILFVDDEENVLSALRRSLRKEGYELFFAASAEQGFEILAKNPIDLVLSDHLMPHMTGLEFLKLVRNRYPHTLRLMLTGHADMQTAVEAINGGEIYRFLAKPWNDGELKLVLQVAVERLELERENRRLLALVRTQHRLLLTVEKEHPGISALVRDSTGAIVIDPNDIPLTNLAS